MGRNYEKRNDLVRKFEFYDGKVIMFTCFPIYIFCPHAFQTKLVAYKYAYISFSYLMPYLFGHYMHSAQES